MVYFWVLPLNFQFDAFQHPRCREHEIGGNLLEKQERGRGSSISVGWGGQNPYGHQVDYSKLFLEYVRMSEVCLPFGLSHEKARNFVKIQFHTIQ